MQNIRNISHKTLLTQCLLSVYSNRRFLGTSVELTLGKNKAHLVSVTILLLCRERNGEIFANCCCNGMPEITANDIQLGILGM